MTSDALVRRVRLLTAFAVCSTAALGALLLGGARGERRATFDELDVQRINVRKPDGHLSLVVSNETRMPGIVYRGREITPPKGTAGLVFYDGDGTEMGGLTFGSRRDGDRLSHSGHLAFDGHGRDQSMTLGYAETWDGDERTSRAGALRFVDRTGPHGDDRYAHIEALHSDDPADREAAQTWFAANGRYGHEWTNRAIVGMQDGASMVALTDPAGQPRVQLTVGEDGAPHVQTLDADGTVQHDLTVDG